MELSGEITSPLSNVQSPKNVGTRNSENGFAPQNLSATREVDEGEVPSSNPVSETRLQLTLLALSFVVILGGMDFSIIGVAVPAITQQFHTISDVGWYNVAYRLTACSFQFTWGQLYSLFSVRITFLGAIVIFLLDSILSAAATSSAMFVAGRAITGIGSGGILGGTFTALMVVAPLRLRPVLISFLTGLEAVAIIAAPILGGALSEVSWRWCFYINLPIGGLVLASLVIFLPDSRYDSTNNETLSWKKLFHKVDAIGNFFFIISVTCLFLALTWANTKYTWSSAAVIILLVVCAGCLAIFIYDQYKQGSSASIPPRILMQRSVMAGALFSFCLNGALGVLQYYIPIYYQSVLGYSALKAGYMMLPVTIGFNIALPIQGIFTVILGYYTPFMLMSSILMPVGAGLITTWTITTDLSRHIVYSGIFGFACGLAFEIPQIAVQTVLEEDDGPLGLSITLFAQNFGGALFISVAQQVFTSELLSNLQGSIPGLNATTIEALGFTDLHSDPLGDSSPEIIAGLENAFVRIWDIGLVLSCITILGSLAME
ncbi:hypothetical protein PISL3812_05542 [Talaromyces islandicus]|uniref:Major facilitator superfamily (MFS) profile domain-containing protein n=1 Tax=Talaromyces islandicus TaxID=28573 RepID=A0A0U1M0I9_TALIS|nr:hypothetical protein PISL3812_05542 [Talaromyces islandicus]